MNRVVNALLGGGIVGVVVLILWAAYLTAVDPPPNRRDLGRDISALETRVAELEDAK